MFQKWAKDFMGPAKVELVNAGKVKVRRLGTKGFAMKRQKHMRNDHAACPGRYIFGPRHYSPPEPKSRVFLGTPQKNPRLRFSLFPKKENPSGARFTKERPKPRARKDRAREKATEKRKFT